MTHKNKLSMAENGRMDLIARGVMFGIGFLITLGSVIYKMKANLKQMQLRRQQMDASANQLATYTSSVTPY